MIQFMALCVCVCYLGVQSYLWIISQRWTRDPNYDSGSEGHKWKTWTQSSAPEGRFTNRCINIHIGKHTSHVIKFMMVMSIKVFLPSLGEAAIWCTQSAWRSDTQSPKWPSESSPQASSPQIDVSGFRTHWSHRKPEERPTGLEGGGGIPAILYFPYMWGFWQILSAL